MENFNHLGIWTSKHVGGLLAIEPWVGHSDYVGFTGGSFQDMTRIAGVDEDVWTRLYMLNREKITKELSILILNLSKYLVAFESNDEESLKNLLKEGRAAKKQLDMEKPII